MMQFGIMPVNPHCPGFGAAPSAPSCTAPAAAALLQALGQAGIHRDPPRAIQAGKDLQDHVQPPARPTKSLTNHVPMSLTPLCSLLQGLPSWGLGTDGTG